jgi:hypothetical protein
MTMYAERAKILREVVNFLLGLSTTLTFFEAIVDVKQ